MEVIVLDDSCLVYYIKYYRLFIIVMNRYHYIIFYYTFKYKIKLAKCLNITFIILLLNEYKRILTTCMKAMDLVNFRWTLIPLYNLSKRDIFCNPIMRRINDQNILIGCRVNFKSFVVESGYTVRVESEMQAPSVLRSGETSTLWMLATASPCSRTYDTSV